MQIAQFIIDTNQSYNLNDVSLSFDSEHHWVYINQPWNNEPEDIEDKNNAINKNSPI